ncbi:MULTISPECIES: hypothetical protein [unclassified Microbacterium]|uniref:hypothetical protein n=1 Tax=unclassified Microbacterium TaxID=2609290 RepID=UPI001D7474AB|nr:MULTISPECIES: hypothetical protein [unclassified Microbacterium]CAH0223486.1 hypothetical protein SRABI121_03030 [Microbacterium sp. Bi121]HWK76628.1 hypothetical protein [Microbacterium sp.]
MYGDSESAEQPIDDSVFDATVWTDAAADTDPAGTNMFTAEIENIDSSDWEVDPDVIWGDDPAAAPDLDGAAVGPDLLA